MELLFALRQFLSIQAQDFIEENWHKHPKADITYS